MPILSTPETTEVIYGAETITSVSVKALSEVKECTDVCWDAAGPSAVVTVEPMWKTINELGKRGVRIRALTDICLDNISYCKMMTDIGIKLRHLPAIKTAFAINDRMEYITAVLIEEKKAPAQYVVSNVKTFVEGQQSLYDTLWSKALPAEQRIREIEEGLKPAFTETLKDPAEIQKTGFDLIKSAKEDILVLFSTPNSLLRQERAGLLQLIRDVTSQGDVKTRILTHANKETNEIVGSLASMNNVDVRHLQQSLQTRLTTLVVDGKFSLEVEVKDDTREDSYNAVGWATYSNSESTVWTHASIFETLWMQAEIDRQRIERKIA